MISILYHPRAIKFLKKLAKKEARNIVQKIDMLQVNPYSPNLDIKKLVLTKKSYRLRIGNIRVIYELDNINNTIYVHEIDFRSNNY